MSRLLCARISRFVFRLSSTMLRTAIYLRVQSCAKYKLARGCFVVSSDPCYANFIWTHKNLIIFCFPHSIYLFFIFVFFYSPNSARIIERNFCVSSFATNGTGDKVMKKVLSLQSIPSRYVRHKLIRYLNQPKTHVSTLSPTSVLVSFFSTFIGDVNATSCRRLNSFSNSRSLNKRKDDLS